MSRDCNCVLAGELEVNYEGSLFDSTILFVGESPGYEELQEPTGPFKGKSGRLLRRTISEFVIPEQLCFFANSARCMINKETLTAREVKSILKACKPKLEVIIDNLNPKVIVVLGAIALEQVLGLKGIKKARGTFYWSDKYSCWVLPNFHPAYILRNSEEEDNFKRVFRTLKAFIDNNYTVKTDTDIDYLEVDSIQPLLDGGFQRAADDSCYITAIDTETQGLAWHRGIDSPVISYSVAANDHEGWNVILYEEVVPWTDALEELQILVQRGGTKDARDWTRVGLRKADNFDQKIEDLKELLSRNDIQKYYMNQKYEMHRFEQLGIDVTDPEQFRNNPIDISLLAHTFNAPRYTNATLSYLVESYCDIDSGYKDEWTDAEIADMLMQLRLDRDKFNRRACFDAVWTMRVALRQIQELHKDRTTLNYYLNFAQPVETGILYEIERNGVHVDMEVLPNVSDDLIDKINVLTEQFKQLCPEPVVNKHHDKFRLTRRNIIMDVLYCYETADRELVDLGFGLRPSEISAKTKLPKVNKDILKVLLDDPIPSAAKDLIQIYQEWGEHHTLLSRYIGQIEDNVHQDEKLYPSYSLTYTSSGRTGARKPSVQNFPKRVASAKLIRRIIKARKGFKLLETDHSMSELRWVADVADEKVMKEIFRSGGDMHLFTGADMAGYRLDIGTKQEMIEQLLSMGVAEEEIKPMRQNAKPVNFGLIYLMSAFGLRNYAYQGYGVKMSEQEASTRKDNFFILYPGISPWHEEVGRVTEQHGSITTKFGRNIPVPNIYSYDRGAQREALRFAVNVQIQGPSSDYTLLGGNQCIHQDWYDREDCLVRLFLHDAFVWEVREDLVEDFSEKIRENMVNIDTSVFGFSLSIPFVADGESGDNLAEMEEL